MARTRQSSDAAVDAALDAGLDAPPGQACTGGGASTVMLDLGGDAAPRSFVAGWLNHGHVTKACFDLDVALSTRAYVEDTYLTDPELLEVTFHQPPVLGANTVQLHLHQPDLFFGGTATLTALTAGDVAGSLTATSGPVTVSGTFSATRCAGIPACDLALWPGAGGAGASTACSARRRRASVPHRSLGRDRRPTTGA